MPIQHVTHQKSSVSSEDSGSSSTPSHQDIIEELESDIYSEWENLGIQLEIEDDVLEQIKNTGDNEACFRKMLKIWLNRVSPPPSWAAIAEAVEVLWTSIACRSFEVQILHCFNTINRTCLFKQYCSSYFSLSGSVRGRCFFGRCRAYNMLTTDIAGLFSLPNFIYRSWRPPSQETEIRGRVRIILNS